MPRRDSRSYYHSDNSQRRNRRVGNRFTFNNLNSQNSANLRRNNPSNGIANIAQANEEQFVRALNRNSRFLNRGAEWGANDERQNYTWERHIIYASDQFSLRTAVAAARRALNNDNDPLLVDLVRIINRNEAAAPARNSAETDGSFMNILSDEFIQVATPEIPGAAATRNNNEAINSLWNTWREQVLQNQAVNAMGTETAAIAPNTPGSNNEGVAPLWNTWMDQVLQNQAVTATGTETAAIAANTPGSFEIRSANNDGVIPERFEPSFNVDIDEIFATINNGQDQPSVDIATNDVSQIDISSGELNDIDIEETNLVQLNGLVNDGQIPECSVETVDQNNNEVSAKEK